MLVREFKRNLDYSRPQGIEKAAETEGGDEHKSKELHHHGTERKDHEVVLECDKSKSGSGEGLTSRRAERSDLGNSKQAITARKSMPMSLAHFSKVNMSWIRKKGKAR